MLCLSFSKASDTLNQSTLMGKLSIFGLDSVVDFINLMKSYLQCGAQWVCLDRHLSDSVCIPSGVLQGSVLWPP